MDSKRYNFDDLFNPMLKALHELGGSATNNELKEFIIKELSLPEKIVNEIHSGSVTKLDYNLAYARNYLKRFGLIDNTERGVWHLTLVGLKTKTVDQNEVYSRVKGNDLSTQILTDNPEQKDEHLEYSTYEVKSLDWKNAVLDKVKQLHPIKFERLCLLLLRELGFENLELTRTVGDEGIDGIGTFKVGGILSFHVVIQCKKWKDVVGSKEIRDFRGAFIGRADKGLFITTSSFSQSAIKESVRDGAPSIELIDGLDLAEKLKQTGLGIKTKLIETIEIDNEWFNEF